jgi:hypothetical protein
MPEGYIMALNTKPSTPLHTKLSIPMEVNKVAIDDGDLEIDFGLGKMNFAVTGTAYELNKVLNTVFDLTLNKDSGVLTDKDTGLPARINQGGREGEILEGNTVRVDFAGGVIIDNTVGGAGGSQNTGGSNNEGGTGNETPITKSKGGKDKGCSISQPGQNGNTNGALGAFALVAAVAAMRNGKRRKS